MNIVKVDATNSTNTFLKELCQQNEVENFTVVVTKKQTSGRGQMQSVWQSDKDKNLTFSVLVKFDDLKIDNQFYLSKVISLAVHDVLVEFLPSKIMIKWPNDILADQSKIAGILIENSVKKTKIVQSIIGIGLNVNQEYFKDLPNATSMKIISDKEYDLNALLLKLVETLKYNIDLLNNNKFDLINELYLKNLYKLKTPAMFKDVNGNLFLGNILGVTKEGKLQVALEDEKIKVYNLKEIKFLNVK